MSERLILISADGHAGPPIAEYRPYVDAELLDEFDRFVVAREAWRVERNRSMGLRRRRRARPRAVRRGRWSTLYLGQEAIERGGAPRCLRLRPSATRELEARGHRRRGALRRLPEQQRAAVGRRVPVPRHHAGAASRRRPRSSTAGSPTSAPSCPGRRAGVAIVQPHDIDAAVARRALDQGGRARQRHAADRRLRAALATTTRATTRSGRRASTPGLPVTFHSGGTPWEGYGPHAMWVTKFEFMWWARRPLWELIFGGVFERFPELRVAFTEQGADWIPSMLERLDEQYALAVRARHHRPPVAVADRVLGPQLLRRRVVHEPRRVRHPRPDRCRPHHVGRRLPAHRGHVAALAGRTARGRQRLHAPRRCG